MNAGTRSAVSRACPRSVLATLGLAAALLTAQMARANMCTPDIQAQLDSEEPDVVLGKPDYYTTNLVFLGDGFTDSSLETYQEAVDEIVKVLESSFPLGPLSEAFTFYRLDVLSKEDGIDIPKECREVDDDLERENALGTHHCGEFVENEYDFILIDAEDPTLVNAFADCPYLDQTLHPGYADQIIVLVNSPYFGGSGHWLDENGGVAYLSLATMKGGVRDDEGDYQEIQETDEYRGTIWATAIHELGHSIFGLGDEYCHYEEAGICLTDSAEQVQGEQYVSMVDEWLDDGVDWEPDVFDDGSYQLEPVAPNLTSYTERDELLIKNPTWERLILSEDDPIHVHRLEACDRGDSELQGNKGIGLYEGAARRSCGLYRPAATCKMNWEPKDPFCAVCRQQLLWELSYYLPGNLYVLIDELIVLEPEFEVLEVTEICLGISIGTPSPPSCTEIKAPALRAALGPFAIREIGFDGLDVSSTGVNSTIGITLELRDANESGLASWEVELPRELGIHVLEADSYRLTVSVTSPFL